MFSLWFGYIGQSICNSKLISLSGQSLRANGSKILDNRSADPKEKRTNRRRPEKAQSNGREGKWEVSLGSLGIDYIPNAA